MIRRIIAACAAAISLCSAAFAYSGTIAEQVEQFRAEHRLTESNFAVSYYDPVSGESYAYNEETMLVAASTFKLPLNLYYYELEQAGEIAPDAYIPNSGTTLANCHRMSLVDSNNEVSIAMLYNLGNFRTYKEKMRKYFTMTDDEIDGKYWSNNYYCTRMMMDALRYLYENEAEFPEMIGYLKQACPDHYFKKYLDCEIAHKYGSFEGAENDVGIIYGENPFLLAVYTQDRGENVSAECAVLFKDYTDSQALARLDAEAAASVPAPVTVALDAPEPPPEPQAEETAFEWWMLPITIAVFLLGSGLVLLILRIQKKNRSV